MITHIVMWTLKATADAAEFTSMLESCSNLVPGMQRFEVACRTAGLEANCDVVLYSVFDSTESLAAYQNHPHHRQLSTALSALRETRHVLDYKTRPIDQETFYDPYHSATL